MSVWDDNADDATVRDHVRRRIIFNLLADAYKVPREVQERVIYGDQETSELVMHLDEDALRSEVIGPVVRELVADGLAEKGARGFIATEFLLHTGVALVPDPEAQRVLLDAQEELAALGYVATNVRMVIAGDGDAPEAVGLALDPDEDVIVGYVPGTPAAKDFDRAVELTGYEVRRPLVQFGRPERVNFDVHRPRHRAADR